MPEPLPTVASSRIQNSTKWWLLTAAVVVFVLFVRVRLVSLPLERDEGEYAYAGQLMLQGIPPYQLAYNMKLPGTYAAYAVVMAVFGQTVQGIHNGLLVVNLASILLMFLLGRRLFDSAAGAVAAAIYGMVSLSPTVLGLAAHATNFVVLFMLAAMLWLQRALDGGRLLDFLGSGILFGLAFLMKQHGIFFGIFGGAWILWIGLKNRPALGWNRLAQRMGAYAAGCVLPFAVVCAWLWHAKVFSTFWFWTFTYAQKYVTALSWAKGLELLRSELARLIVPHWMFALLATIGAWLLLRDRTVRDRAQFLTGFFVFSAAAVTPGLYFREHYFLLLLPAAALMAGVAVSFGGRLAAERGSSRWIRLLPATAVVFGLVFAAAWQANYFLGAGLVPTSQKLFGLTRSIYGSNPFFESEDIGAYIREHSPKDARVMVFGSEPQIYFYAQRHSASGFIYMYDLMDNQPFAVEMQKQLIQEVEAARPDYFILVKVAASWAQQRSSPTLMMDWGENYCREHFTIAGVYDIYPDRTDVVWGDPAAASTLHPGAQVLVFARKPAG